MKTRFVLPAAALLALIVWLAFPVTASRPRANIPKDVRNHIGGDLNYRASWTPTVEGGGPAMIALSGALNTTSDKNPFWYSFHVTPGTTLRQTAKALNAKDGRPGWVECWFFDSKGALLAHDGPTDAPTGCSVKGTAS